MVGSRNAEAIKLISELNAMTASGGPGRNGVRTITVHYMRMRIGELLFLNLHFQTRDCNISFGFQRSSPPEESHYQLLYLTRSIR